MRFIHVAAGVLAAAASGDAGGGGGGGAPAPKADEPPKVKTVRMKRHSEAHAGGGPKTADVHPDEVENYEAHGWHKDTDPPAKEPPAKK